MNTTTRALVARLARARGIAAAAVRRRARNVRFLAAASRTGRSVRLPAPLLAVTRPGTPSWFRVWTGISPWPTVAGVRKGAVEVVRTRLDAVDAAPVASLAAVLAEALPKDREVRELAGLAAMLCGRPEEAEQHVYHALQGSVAWRRANAGPRLEHVRERLALRAAIADHVSSLDVAQAREDALSAPFTREGALERAAEDYVLPHLARVDLAALRDVVSSLVAAGYLAVATDDDLPGLNAVLDEATARADEADFEGALEALHKVPARREALIERYLLELARSLAAVSRYEEARLVLRILGGSEATAGVAAAREAQIAWVVHDYEGAVDAARKATRAGMPSRSVRGVRERSLDPLTPADAPAGGIGHVAFFVDAGENFGDVALPVAVRAAIEEAAGPREWLPFHAHQVFDDSFVRAANTQRALVVGGGGLFLPDTSPNGNSGWQWNVPRASLEAIDVPLFVYSVGYNLFPGQEFQGSLFARSLEALARKAEYLGLRNHGSMARVADMLPAELAEKVRYIPCPTTVLERLRDDLPEKSPGSGRVLVNAAFDRSARRFGDTYPAFLEQMRDFVEAAEKAGAEVRFVAHTRGDLRLANDLQENFGLERPVDALHDLSPDEAYGVYRSASLVIGMRGHATMIPFGLGTPVLSIVSHPKMRYFLEDIGRVEWGVDVHDERLGARLTELTADILGREQGYRDDIHTLQDGLLVPVRAAAADIAATLDH